MLTASKTRHARNTLRALCGTAALAASLATPTGNLQAADYSQLVVFGDSLSDPGNAYALTGGNFPPPPYARTFSNGPTAAQYMADSLGAGITNYAVGGAMTNADNYLALTVSTLAPALGNTGISAQIDRWNPAGLDPSSTLFMVWGGPNDFFYSFDQASMGVTVDFEAVVTNTVANIANDIKLLTLKGAHDFFVPGMPDLGITPRANNAGASFAALASSMSASYNTGLSLALADLRSSLGITIHGFDTAQYMHTIAANPPAGLTDVSTPCIANGAAISNGCAGYEYFDDVHPTTFAHGLIGNAFAAAVPEPAPAALMTLGLIAIAATARRRVAAGA